MKPAETVLEFVDAVNRQHIDKMIGMMTPDHLFTDSLGKEIPDRRSMRDAWLCYFRMVPDYAIEVREVYTSKKSVVAVGTATGTYSKDGKSLPENRFTIRAAWRAVVERDRICEGQVLADNLPRRDLMAATADITAERTG